MDIGERIKKARETGKLSKSELARRIGVHPSACIQWESKGGTKPTVDHLAQVAVVLNVRFEWLATGRGDMEYTPGAAEERPPYTASESVLGPEERNLLQLYRSLKPSKRKALMDLIGALEQNGPKV